MSVSRKPSDTVSETNQHDALTVLRDLVDLFDNVGIGVRGRKERFDHAWARARALVAEHATEQEST